MQNFLTKPEILEVLDTEAEQNAEINKSKSESGSSGTTNEDDIVSKDYKMDLKVISPKCSPTNQKSWLEELECRGEPGQSRLEGETGDCSFLTNENLNSQNIRSTMFIPSGKNLVVEHP